MFVGHGLLAFVLVALLARRFEAAPRRALALGAVAALFATIPDVDIVYGLAGLLGGISGPEAVLSTVFETGNVVHRGPTHSLVVGTVAAGAFGLLCHRATMAQAAGLLGLVTLVAVAATAGSALDATVTAAFVIVGLGVVALARYLDVNARWVAASAAVGLLSHPLGDLVTGDPPDVLFPFDVVLFESHVALHPDPTVHLLGAFAIELAIVWAAFVTYARLTDREPLALVDRRAVAGVAYGVAAVVLPAPTLSAAEPFVFSVLAVGVVGVAPSPTRWRPALPRAIGTGLAAVSLAAVAYALVYLVV